MVRKSKLKNIKKSKPVRKSKPKNIKKCSNCGNLKFKTIQKQYRDPNKPTKEFNSCGCGNKWDV